MHDRSPETLRVSSSTFASGESLPKSTSFDQMGCTGDNRSPHLAWSEVPADTKSFAVILHDPDAPTGVGFFHWLVAGIPGDVRELPEGAGAGLGLPSGVVNGHNDFGFNGYGGPCPPPGDAPHHYEFTVYALRNELDVDPSLTGAKLRFLTRGNILASGTLVGRFGR
jgi:Raf kinase inhibitor-like YbhB/YbcL family protein